MVDRREPQPPLRSHHVPHRPFPRGRQPCPHLGACTGYGDHGSRPDQDGQDQRGQRCASGTDGPLHGEPSWFVHHRPIDGVQRLRRERIDLQPRRRQDQARRTPCRQQGHDLGGQPGQDGRRAGLHQGAVRGPGEGVGHRFTGLSATTSPTSRTRSSSPVVAEIAARADYLRAKAPAQKSFIVVLDGTNICKGTLGCEYAALAPPKSHVDVVGVDVYPCHLGAPCDFAKIPQRVNAAIAAGVPRGQNAQRRLSTSRTG